MRRRRPAAPSLGRVAGLREGRCSRGVPAILGPLARAGGRRRRFLRRCVRGCVGRGRIPPSLGPLPRAGRRRHRRVLLCGRRGVPALLRPVAARRYRRRRDDARRFTRVGRLGFDVPRWRVRDGRRRQLRRAHGLRRRGGRFFPRRLVRRDLGSQKGLRAAWSSTTTPEPGGSASPTSAVVPRPTTHAVGFGDGGARFRAFGAAGD